MAERRKQSRTTASHPISYRRVDKDEHAPQVSTRSVNASDHGLALMVTEPMDIDETLALEIQPNPDRPAILAVGRVVWCRVDGDGFLVGVEFVWLGCPSLSEAASMMPVMMWPFR